MRALLQVLLAVPHHFTIWEQQSPRRQDQCKTADSDFWYMKMVGSLPFHRSVKSAQFICNRQRNNKQMHSRKTEKTLMAWPKPQTLGILRKFCFVFSYIKTQVSA